MLSEFLLAGADAVQIGTCFYEEGPGVLFASDRRICSDHDNRGYKYIADAKGKLKLL